MGIDVMKKSLFFAVLAVAAVCEVSCTQTTCEGMGSKYESIAKDVSFDTLLGDGQTEYRAVEVVPEQNVTYDTTFTDDEGIVSFDHSYSDWGFGYSFGGFTVTNDRSVCAANGGSTANYLYVYTSDFQAASFTLANPEYTLEGVLVTNSATAYTDMTEGNAFGARPFAAGDKYTLTATGYDASNSPIGTVSIDLANYASDSDKPVSEWVWFDLTPIAEARRVEFTVASTDMGEFGINTSTYFCMNGLTLIL